MRRFVSYAHVTSGLVAPLSYFVTLSFCVASSFQQIDAVQGYITEVGTIIQFCNIIDTFFVQW